MAHEQERCRGLEGYAKNRKALYDKKEKAKPYNLKKFVLWVVRRNGNGDLRNAMPCNECCKTLKKLGFRKVAYSTDSGEIHMVDMRTFMNDHLSNSQKTTAIHSKAI